MRGAAECRILRPVSHAPSAVPVEISGGPFPPDRQDVLAAVLARVPGIEPEEAALLAVVTPCVVRAADEARLVEDLFAAGFEARYVAEPVGTNPAVLTTPADANVVPVAASVGPSRVGIWIAVGALAVVGAGLVGVGIGGRRAEPPPAPATDVLPGVSEAREVEPLLSTPATPAARPSEEGAWTTYPTTRASETARTATLHSVRTGHHDSYDRIVFEFAGTELPAIRVISGDLNPSTSLCRGEIPLEGGESETLLVSLGESVDAFGGQSGPAVPLPTLIEYWPACAGAGAEYPDALVYGIGLDARRPYRTLVLRDPLRFVLDVQNGT